MATMIALNSVLRMDVDAHRGFFRVLCCHPTKGLCFLGFIEGLGGRKRATCVPGSVTSVPFLDLCEWLESGHARKVELTPPARQTLPVTSLSRAAQQSYMRRLVWAAPLMNPKSLAEALVKPRGLGRVIKQAVEAGASRAGAYRLWRDLCARGFDASALIATFDRCGASGQTRPVSERRKKAGRKTLAERLGKAEPQPQRGLNDKDRLIIVRLYRVHFRAPTTERKVYEQIILNGYVERYAGTGKDRVPVLPPMGSFPNRRQVRHVIDTEITKLEKIRRRTTQGHFDRNFRGLRGTSIDGVAGPGHTYAIDSTIGDLFLRSSINRSWLIGRPIVYLIVDMWSTAIVGYYICLSWPSWATAKVALFCTLCGPRMLSGLWGLDEIPSLNPAPGLPFRLLCDRGEYLSQGAQATMREIGVNEAFNSARRPDLKGLVEVLHRILKDEQYTSFVPGAFDARRKELELRPDLKESALTMREYAQYLHLAFTQYNLLADRSRRMTGDMIAARVMPSPAGLWRYGYEAGLGYLKDPVPHRLITQLLPATDVVVRRNGVHMAHLLYQGQAAAQGAWTARARNFGAFVERVHHFPGSVSKLWWPNPEGGLADFDLAPNANTVPETVLDEWLDAVTVKKLRQGEQSYAQLLARLSFQAQTTALMERAKKATRHAEENSSGPAPGFRQARGLEILTGPADELHPNAPLNGHVEPPPRAIESEAEFNPYEECKQSLLRQLNQEEPPNGR